MHDHGTPSGEAAQRAVLSLVLDAHPKFLTISDLARELGAQAVESAVAALVGVGLLDRKGETISPSAAALHFDRLDLPNIAQRFGANLVQCRLRADLSQEELSFRAGLHRTEIGLLERGCRIPRIDTLAKLAGALGVTPAELLDGIEWRPAETRPGGFRFDGEGEP